MQKMSGYSENLFWLVKSNLSLATRLLSLKVSLEPCLHIGNQQQSVSVLSLRENKVDLSIDMFLLHKVRKIT